MDKQPLGTKIITQIGVIVRDIEAVSQAYADFLGVEKPAWFWTDAVDVAKTEYLGAPSPARAKLAFLIAVSCSWNSSNRTNIRALGGISWRRRGRYAPYCLRNRRDEGEDSTA